MRFCNKCLCKERVKSRSLCKECYASYQRAWRLKNPECRRKIEQNRTLKNHHKILEYLSGHPCADCGIKDLRVLQFDHLRDKTASVMELVNKHVSWPTIMKEINKCEVRCANCHLIKTRERGTFAKRPEKL